jgi:hypothetical protein
MPQQLLNPRGIFRVEENPIAPRLTDLNHKVLGLVDSSKPNAIIFLNRIQELISKKYIVSEIFRTKKANAGIPTSFTQEFFDRCDFAVNAFAD